MTTADLNKDQINVYDGLDSIVIVNDLGDVPGGRTLNVSGVSSDISVIKSGHIIIENNTTGEVSPLGVTSGAYVTLPSGSSYLGVLKASIPKRDARAAILTIGQVNAAASPYPVTSAIKTGLPRIEFIN